MFQTWTVVLNFGKLTLLTTRYFIFITCYIFLENLYDARGSLVLVSGCNATRVTTMIWKRGRFCPCYIFNHFLTFFKTQSFKLLWQQKCNIYIFSFSIAWSSKNFIAITVHQLHCQSIGLGIIDQPGASHTHTPQPQKTIKINSLDVVKFATYGWINLLSVTDITLAASL